IGSHGEGGVTDWSLGSTAQQVLATARSSVYIARGPCGAAGEGKGVATKRILLPLDGSLRTESVLPVAARIASAQGAELLRAHVQHGPTVRRADGALAELLRRPLAGPAGSP